jgi:hypothetical protein
VSTMLPGLAIGTWTLYLTLIAPPCYRAWRSNRVSVGTVRLLLLPGPSVLSSPTTTELQTDEWRLT